MGTVRLLLALCVLDFHSVADGNQSLWWTYVPNGVVAVQSFYVISGFYMSLVLTGRYANEPVWVFYRARLLRLLPAYWIVATAALAYAIVARWPIVAEFLSVSHDRPLLGAWVVFSNLTMIGQDWNWFFQSPYGVLGRYNVVHVAWTLGVELTFYAMVPALVLLRSRWIVALLTASIAARVVGTRYGLVGEPWDYRFFPFELAWFLLGMMAHRIYVIGSKLDSDAMRRVGIAAFLLLLLSICWYPLYFNPITGRMFPGSGTALPYATALALPFVFALTKNSKLDSFIGEFSYPIYLVHAVVLLVLIWLGYNNGPSVLILSLLFSAAILFVLRPIERVRQPPAVSV